MNVEFCKGARHSGLVSVWQHTLVGQLFRWRVVCVCWGVLVVCAGGCWCVFIHNMGLGLCWFVCVCVLVCVCITLCACVWLLVQDVCMCVVVSTGYMGCLCMCWCVCGTKTDSTHATTMAHELQQHCVEHHSLLHGVCSAFYCSDRCKEGVFALPPWTLQNDTLTHSSNVTLSFIDLWESAAEWEKHYSGAKRGFMVKLSDFGICLDHNTREQMLPCPTQISPPSTMICNSTQKHMETVSGNDDSLPFLNICFGLHYTIIFRDVEFVKTSQGWNNFDCLHVGRYILKFQSWGIFGVVRNALESHKELERRDIVIAWTVCRVYWESFKENQVASDCKPTTT